MNLITIFLIAVVAIVAVGFVFLIVYLIVIGTTAPDWRD